MNDQGRPGKAASTNDYGGPSIAPIAAADSTSLLADGRDILAALRDRGLRVRVDDNGQIRVGPRELVDDADRALLREHREVVVAALASEEVGLIAGGRSANPVVSCGGRERL